MPAASANFIKPNWLWLILISALAVRLIFVLLIDPSPKIAGGDTQWLLMSGRTLLDGTIPEPPQTGPVYLVYAGVIQGLSGPGALQLLRVLNALMGAALCGFVYRLGKGYFNARTGLLAALVLAFNPMFIIEAGNVLTESVFLFLLFGALAIYAQADAARLPSSRRMAVVGVLLGLAILTRAAALLLPVILVVHLSYVYRRPALRLIGVLLITYMLTLSTWTVYNLIKWNRFVIGADGLLANIYIGTTDGWCGPQCIDQQAGITGNGDNQTKYAQGALASITGDPLGYLRRRLSNISEALLQPYNTVYYPGESIKNLFVAWWGQGHPLSGLGRIATSEAFWPKLVLYLFHYLALVFGLIGMLIGLRQFWPRLPAYGTLLYFVALHTILTANPRYLFPAEPVWCLFAVYALLRFAAALSPNQHGAEAKSPRRDDAQQPA